MNICGECTIKQTDVDLRITQELGPGVAQRCADGSICF